MGHLVPHDGGAFILGSASAGLSTKPPFAIAMSLNAQDHRQTIRSLDAIQSSKVADYGNKQLGQRQQHSIQKSRKVISFSTQTGVALGLAISKSILTLLFFSLHKIQRERAVGISLPL
jgi:hypothetical protein